MGCGLSTPIITEDGSAPAPAPAPPSAAPRVDEIKGSKKPHRRTQSQACFKEMQETEPLMEGDRVPERKSVSGRIEGVEESEQGVAVDLKETIENLKGENVAVREKEIQMEERGEEGREEERDGSEIGPGSPSFREYCLHPTTNSVNLDAFKHSKSFEPKKEEKHRRRHSITSTEGSNTILMKKEHKSGRFKGVIHKGGQSVVRNILNVTGCYCTNPHPHNHLESATST